MSSMERVRSNIHDMRYYTNMAGVPERHAAIATAELLLVVVERLDRLINALENMDLDEVRATREMRIPEV